MTTRIDSEKVEQVRRVIARVGYTAPMHERQQARRTVDELVAERDWARESLAACNWRPLYIERTGERDRWRTAAQLLFDFICREWPEARAVVREVMVEAETPPPGPPDPASRHVWGLAGPRGEETQ